MGGVDKSDQMLTSYEVERKRVKKWYKKVFHHHINQSVFNAQIIHKTIGGNLTPLKFWERLIHDIVVKYHPDYKPIPGKHGQGGVNQDLELRLVGRHFMVYCNDSNEKGQKKKSRRCVVCTKKGKRKDSRFFCPDCDVGLCAVPCSKDYHTKKVYWILAWTVFIKINFHVYTLLQAKFFWFICTKRYLLCFIMLLILFIVFFDACSNAYICGNIMLSHIVCVSI